MVATTEVAAHAAGHMSPAATATSDASIAAYLGAGDRMLTLMDLTWKVSAVLGVLVILAWAFRLLPGAIRLF